MNSAFTVKYATICMAKLFMLYKNCRATCRAIENIVSEDIFVKIRSITKGILAFTTSSQFSNGNL